TSEGGSRMPLRLVLAAGVLTCVLAGAGQVHAASAPDFGPNVLVFDPSMSTSQIRAAVDAVSTQQLPNQFGTQRYALLFMPGTYGSPADPLNFQAGYYMHFAGLGGCTALVNFWRSVSNLKINVAGKGGCQSGEFWATSQAAPLRRVDVNGLTTLMDYCTGP